MLCQVCQTNTAEVRISHIVNNKKLEIHLCEDCADEKGVNSPLMNLPQLFHNFIGELLGNDLIESAGENFGKKCPGCGSTWQHFQDEGLFGCDICYQFFQEDLKIVLRRIHGSNQHIGSRPKSYRYWVDESELVDIKTDLERAIREENFERAAELRDMIRDAQREIDKRTSDATLR